MNIHSTAYLNIAAAYAGVMGKRPTECEVAMLAAVSWHETKYGKGWDPPGAGSFNMGAITEGSGWNGETFSYSDSRPEGKTDLVYVTRFRKYPSEEDGYKDLVRAVFLWSGRITVQNAAKACNVVATAQALYDSSYFKGRAAQSPSERVRAYATALENAIRTAGVVPMAVINRGMSLWPFMILGTAGWLFYSTVKGPKRSGERLSYADNR